MTPGDLDDETIAARLRSMRELLDDLAVAGQVNADRLRQDRLLRHAVERILSQLVDLAVAVNSHVASARLREVPRDYRDSFRLAADAGLLSPDLATRLALSVGLRNVLVHEYVDIDLEIVAASAGQAREDYGAYVRSVARALSP